MNIRKHMIIPVAYGTIFFLGFYLSMFQSTILNFTQYHEINSIAMGITIGANYLGVSILPLSIGMMTEKIGKKSVTIASYALIIIGTASVFLSANITIHMLSFFLIGGGYGISEATLSAILVDEFPEKSNMHMNLSQMFFSVGALSGPFIAKSFINQGFSFKLLYVFISVIFVLFGILFVFSKQTRTAPIANDLGKPSVIKVIKNRIFILITCALFLYVGIEELIGFFADRLLFFTTQATHFSALALSLYWGLMIPSRFLAGIIKLSIKTKVLICTLMVVLASILVCVSENIAVRLTCFAVIGFGCGPIWPLLMATAGMKFPNYTGSVFNILMSLGGMGGVVLPFVAGILVNFQDERYAYILAAVSGVLLIMFYMLSTNQKKHNE